MIVQLNGYRTADLIQVEVARHYESSFGNSIVSIGMAPAWDIKFSNGQTMEVKYDIAASRTFNAAIEYWDMKRNIPTGILSTTASIWLHCVPQGELVHCYELDTKVLLKRVIEGGKSRSAGDYGTSLIRLLPMQQLKDICKNEFDLRSDIIKHIVMH